MTTCGTVRSRKVEVSEVLQDDVMVTKDSDTDSGHRREEDNANKEEDDANNDSFQVHGDEEIFQGLFTSIISASYSC